MFFSLTFLSRPFIATNEICSLSDSEYDAADPAAGTIDGFLEAGSIRLCGARTARRALSLLAGESRLRNLVRWRQKNQTP